MMQLNAGKCAACLSWGVSPEFLLWVESHHHCVTWQVHVYFCHCNITLRYLHHLAADAADADALLLQHAVFVWDLDESLILLHSLVSGKYAAACGEQAADGQQLAGLAQQMQRLVLQLADDHLFFKQVRAQGEGGGAGGA
jgi:hypothetical protein